MPETTLSCLYLSASSSYFLYNKCSQCHTNFSCVMSRYNSFTEHTKILLLYCTPAVSMWLLSGMTTEAWHYPLSSELNKLTEHLVTTLSASSYCDTSVKAKDQRSKLYYGICPSYDGILGAL